MFPLPLAFLVCLGALHGQTLIVQVSNPTAGTPAREVQADGRVAVRVEASQPVTGDMAGMLTERSTQIFDAALEKGIVASSAYFKIETASGTIEGTYSGLLDRA